MTRIGAARNPRGRWTREYLAQVLFFGVPIGVATVVAIFMFHHFDIQMVEQNLRATENHHLHLRDVMIRQNLETAMGGLRLLAALQEREAKPAAAARGFRPFCREYAQYRQIRYVAAGDRELARVVCQPHHSGALSAQAPHGWIAPALASALAALTAERIYVSGIATLPGGDGADGGAIPVVHLATLLPGTNGDARRYIVVDVDLRGLISDFMLDTGQGGTMILVQADGRFVRTPTGSERWGDTLAPGTARPFGEVYPRVWQAMHASSRGVVEAPGGLFAYLTLDLSDLRPPAAAGDGRDLPALVAPRWRIVSYVSDASIEAGRSAVARKLALLIPAPLLVTIYLAHLAVRRRRAVHNMEQNERYLRQIMDSVVDGIITTDASGRIERANAATAALFGLGSLEALPRDVRVLVPPAGVPPASELARLWGGERSARRPARAELELPRRDGSVFPAEVVLMEAELGGERRFVWIVRDISERHAFEAKQNAERMRFFHQTKMAEIGLIAAGIIHEVGNPIAAIAGMVTQMAEEADEGRVALDEPTREKLRLIASQAQRLGGITREISDFVRTRPGEEELFDLNSLVRSVVRLVAYDARWKDIRITLELDGEIPAIAGVPDQVAQVLMNLLVNAGDAVQERPPDVREVTVRTEQRGAWVVTTVADSGPGMDEETRRRAFDSFYTTKPEGKGTGLGLSLCQSIVEAHQGTIEIESAQGRGAAIRVSLPVPEPAQSSVG